MKKLKLASLALSVMFLLSACEKEIDGSGHFITTTRMLPPFDGVTSSGDFTIILVEDPVSRVELHGEDNILPEIETVVSGNQLKIYYDHHHFNYDHNGVTIAIYSPSFKSVDLQGSGKISNIDTLHFTSLDVNVSGSGKIDLLVDNLLVNTAISGSGKIYLGGGATRSFHKISGSGDLHAFNLVSEEVSVTISGSGKARVYAVNNLHATISGSGDVIYRGNPQITSSISGSGHIKPE